MWLLQRLGCPECYTAPEHVWKMATQRGMHFVTITDHNTITGALEIAQVHDNVILGEEVTTYFPGNVKVHVGCIGITESQHQDIQALRENIYDLVAYLHQEQIISFCAHPLVKVNGRLQWEHFEKLLLLFKRFEILNGTRLGRINRITEEIVASLTQEQIERLADKHNLAPYGERPWEKFVTGGTDDHCGIFIGTCYTEVEAEALTKDALLEGLRQGKSRPRGSSDSSLTLSHQINSIAFQYYKSKISPESEELLYILSRIFERENPVRISNRLRFKKGFKKLVKYFFKPKQTKVNLVEEIREIIKDNTSLKSLFNEGLMTRNEYNQNVFNLASDVLDQMIMRVIEKPQLLHYFIIFAPILLSSYFLTSKHLHSNRDLIAKGEAWLGIKRPRKIAWFTDSFSNMDGVSKTCRKFLESARMRGKDLWIYTSHKDDLSSEPGVVNLPPIHAFPTPGYEKVTLYLPSILKAFKKVEEDDLDAVVISTPGPVGILGLLCAKIMGIPAFGIYHTDLPRIAMRVSGDAMFGQLAMQLTRLFYRQVDHVLAPSRWYVEDLQNLGIEEEHIGIMERWIDPRAFSPAHRDEAYWPEDAPVNLLFVGRMSKDKNVDVLIELYRYLEGKYDNFVLHCVGDGPYYSEMVKKTAALPRFIMTGAKFGKDLAAAYASSDVFVYPGLLDTFGNVIIEAQASGLPCVVMNEGGPKELIVPGKTGFVSRTPDEFIQNTERFFLQPELIQDMSREAVRHVSNRFTEDRVFEAFWDCISQPVPNGYDAHRFQLEPQKEIPPEAPIRISAKPGI
jgi:glycosyltransferase involved in cell wall biosynthesis